MLDDEQIDRLCHGRIIKASVYNSSGTNAAGPHWAVMLDTDETIREHDSFYVVVISHDDKTDKFLMPIPPHTGLTGFIQGSWVPVVELAGITDLGPKLFAPEMIEVHKLVRAARAARPTKKRST